VCAVYVFFEDSLVFDIMCINNLYDRIADGLGYVLSFVFSDENMIYKIIAIILLTLHLKVNLIATRPC
jgi:hypothetical protein